MNNVAATIDKKELVEFCRKNHIKRLGVFGSVLRGEERAASDIDILVEFDPEHIPGLRFFSLNDDLEAIFHRKVDLNTPGFLSREIRDQVMNEMQILYE